MLVCASYKVILFQCRCLLRMKLSYFNAGVYFVWSYLIWKCVNLITLSIQWNRRLEGLAWLSITAPSNQTSWFSCRMWLLNVRLLRCSCLSGIKYLLLSLALKISFAVANDLVRTRQRYERPTTAMRNSMRNFKQKKALKWPTKTLQIVQCPETIQTPAITDTLINFKTFVVLMKNNRWRKKRGVSLLIGD